MFFSKRENSKIISEFVDAQKDISYPDDLNKMQMGYSIIIMKDILIYPDHWDNKCIFSIQHKGGQFIKLLKDFDSTKGGHISSIFVIAYRFLCERDFNLSEKQTLSTPLNSIISHIQNDIEKFSGHTKSEIINATYIMPIQITKEFLRHKDVNAFKNFEEKKREAENLLSDMTEKLDEKTKEANKLSGKLDEYKAGFNFVGLYDGFSKLLEKKKREEKFLLYSLGIMGIVLLCPLLYQLISTIGMDENSKLGFEKFFMLIPLVSIEIILIYFFRILLINHKSVKAQIMQIELRQTLCQFIQNYTEYSSAIKKEDSSALEKFESLIFSGIISNPEKLPSTFDGLDKIGGIIKTIKK